MWSIWGLMPLRAVPLYAVELIGTSAIFRGEGVQMADLNASHKAPESGD
jgi:hypothetical protein